MTSPGTGGGSARGKVPRRREGAEEERSVSGVLDEAGGIRGCGNERRLVVPAVDIGLGLCGGPA